jgi:GGDEF domain-containing protein
LTASDDQVLPPWITGEFDIGSLLHGAPRVRQRAQFLDDVDRQLQITRRSIDSRFAVILFDLDSYAGIVSQKGRTAAEILLRAIIEPVGPLLAPRDSIALLGNGLVGVLVETARLRASPQEFAAEAVGQMKIAAVESGVDEPAVSVGIAKITGNYVTGEDILRDAGLALQAAQSAGRDQTMVFHRGMDEFLQAAPIAI